ncbi:hypothetical protein HF521_018425 [Silurus meridionalis]|uniref:Uncharacterized protein n=1 Tax=Silurus meridionalis TaxID=175797 RepID=A0A8T0BNQ9_SILME|nr:hypothetical protein HF521_018425 [Silurus meridionalis]
MKFLPRRNFIDSDVLRSKTDQQKILQAYSCFKELDHAMDKLWRIIEPNNWQYIFEVKGRWETFYSMVKKICEVMQKAMKPSRTLNGDNHNTYIYRHIFSSPVLLVGEENCMMVVGVSEGVKKTAGRKVEPNYYQNCSN